MCCKTNFSMHFMVTDVSATGLKSFIAVEYVFFGTGTIIEDLKIRGTVPWRREVLKMSIYTNSLPHTSTVIFSVAVFESLGICPFGGPDGFLDLVSGMLILHDIT